MPRKKGSRPSTSAREAPPKRATPRRRHPPVPSSGGLFEGFAVELTPTAKRTTVQRRLSEALGDGWTMASFGDGEVDFEVTSAAASLTTRQAWDKTYQVRALPGVAYAEPMFAVSVSDNPAWQQASDGRLVADGLIIGQDGDLLESDPPEWSLDAVQARAAWSQFFPDPNRPPGAGIVIGHPDTGYQDHPEIIDRIIARDGYDFVHDDPDAHDELERPRGVLIPNPGHGTGTASVIVSPPGAQSTYRSGKWVSGVAPGARLIPIRTAFSVALTSTRNLSRAIEHAANHGAHVISISMGGVPSWRLRRAVAYAQTRGVIVCAAAGNYVPFVVWPAAYDEVMCCAASNAGGGVWKWSAHGGAVDVTAPGESVWRASIERTNGRLVFDVGRGSGTSFAATTVAGLAALWLSRHGRGALVARYGAEKLPMLFNRLICATAARISQWKRGEFGAGLPQAVALLSAPLPDLTTDAIATLGPQLDGHPDLDNGGLATFGHLFRANATTPGGDAIVESNHSAIRRALGTLLETPLELVDRDLRSVGQELAFHLATDPVAYRQFRELVLDRRAGPQRADAGAPEAGNALRARLAPASSATLSKRLTGGRRDGLIGLA